MRPPETYSSNPRAAIRAAFVSSVLLTCVLVSNQTASQTLPPLPERRLDAVERALESSRRRADDLAREERSLDGDLSTIRNRLIETARATQRHEETLTATEERLRRFETAARAAEARVVELRPRLAALSAAAQRFAFRPPEAFLASPKPPVDTARAAMLMRVALASLSEVVRETDENLAQLARLEAEILSERENASRAAERLAAEREQLERLMARKSALRDETERTQEEVGTSIAELGRSAETLKGLVAQAQKRSNDRLLEADLLARSMAPPTASAEGLARPGVAPPRTAPTVAQGTGASAPTETTRGAGFVAQLPHGPSISTRKGNLVRPVAGEVIETFGHRNETGVTTKGLTFATRPGAQVVALHDGKVIYAGAFRSYGRIIIIDHSDGYHSLIAGLGRIDLAVGQGVLAGEPIGVMPLAGASSDTGNSASGPTGPTLYMELRRDGAPIDPLAWIARTNTEVRG